MAGGAYATTDVARKARTPYGWTYIRAYVRLTYAHTKVMCVHPVQAWEGGFHKNKRERALRSLLRDDIVSASGVLP